MGMGCGVLQCSSVAASKSRLGTFSLFIFCSLQHAHLGVRP